MIYTVTLNPAVDYVVFVSNFQEDQLNKTEAEYQFPGGKGINVSRILKNLGTPSVNLGFIGGFTGEFINNNLAALDLKTDFISVGEATRINIKLKSQVETEINGQGPTIQPNELLALKKQLEILTSTDMVVFSGSVPKGLPATIYQELIATIKPAKVPFAIDISSQSLLDVLADQPLLIKPNHHELAEIFSTTFSSFKEMIPYGEKLVALGAKNVLISMGKEGAALFNKTGVYRAPGLKGQLKNSVGSGDSMVAGFISQLKETQDPLEAFKYGVAAGSATAFSEDLASGEEIQSLVEQVIIEQVK
ncbi:1-phosphofructokinase [Vagococcus sp.]|uniref:1-phosphofructokinase n=1 Tax=Vagococcus sp. TaxID=1933889 RepID=UPI003F9E83FF